jgi:transcriptional adapter 3
LDLRDSIDKNISNAYTKLQKKDVPKLGKKKKKSDINGTMNGVANGAVIPTPCPAALGLGPDEEHRLIVPESLKRLVETRRQWVDTVGGVFEEKQRENPGRIWLFPKKSVYEGIQDDVKREIERSMLAVPDFDRRTNKGKEKAKGDDMDIG